MIESQQETPARRQRATNRDAVEVRQAIAQTLRRFDAWRDRAAVLREKAGRREPDAQTVLATCLEIRRQIADARTELIVSFADTRARIAGHSRVVDVERALDSLEVELQAIERDAANAD